MNRQPRYHKTEHSTFALFANRRKAKCWQIIAAMLATERPQIAIDLAFSPFIMRGIEQENLTLSSLK